MEVSRRGLVSELQLPVYATVTATQNPSYVCDLHHSSWQCQILNPLSKARDQTHNLMVPSRICFCCAMMGTPWSSEFVNSLVSLLWTCLIFCFFLSHTSWFSSHWNLSIFLNLLINCHTIVHSIPLYSCEAGSSTLSPFLGLMILVFPPHLQSF